MNRTSLQRRTAIARRPATARDIALLRNLFADAHIELTVLPPDTRFVLIDISSARSAASTPRNTRTRSTTS